MLEERAVAVSPSFLLPQAPRPPSMREQSMAAGEGNNQDDKSKQHMLEQEHGLSATHQQPHHTTFPASATNTYGGQPTAPNYPTWLTPPWPFLLNYGSDRRTTRRVLLLTSCLPWICTPSRLSYKITSNPGQATRRRPQDPKARQPHTSAQAQHTEICAAVHLPAKSTTPSRRSSLQDHGCLSCKQTGLSQYDYPTCPSNAGCGQHQ